MRKTFDGAMHWLMLTFGVSKGEIRQWFYRLMLVGWAINLAVCFAWVPTSWIGVALVVFVFGVTAKNAQTDLRFDIAAGDGWSRADLGGLIYAGCAFSLSGVAAAQTYELVVKTCDALHKANLAATLVLVVGHALLWAICGTPPKPPEQRLRRLVPCEEAP